MHDTRKYFTQDYLILQTRESFIKGLARHKILDPEGSAFSNADCLMAGLAVFSFKYPSLLQFDKNQDEDKALKSNLQSLFGLSPAPCDTQMRTRLDRLTPQVCRQAFRDIFKIIQRSNTLEHFIFLKKYYLISIDGTGFFSSPSVHCENCCVKEHRDGRKTYYHQMLSGVLVHPDQSVVFPFAPEPITNTDGKTKNDCERNASKRWIQDFRREHPHLSAVIVADGLSSNAPFIEELRESKCQFILGCREGDHKYLVDWLKAADDVDAPTFVEKTTKGTESYQYMIDVPLNASQELCRVNVVRYQETVKGKTRTWMWVTDLPVNEKNIREIVKGGRARWKIENETFNTLKNQGYQFEHNFGHGEQHLSTVFAHLMMLAFFIDQCLKRFNKRFQEAYAKYNSFRALWERMRAILHLCYIPTFETIYETIIRPPPFKIKPAA